MYQYQPKTMINAYGDGRMRLRNPVIGATVTAGAAGPHTEIGFSTDTGLERPLERRSRLQTSAIRALNAQALDALPSARNPNPASGASSRNFPTAISFEAITDEKDQRLSRERGRPTNQRASAYKKSTGGAFNAYPPKHWFNTDWPGYTEKIDNDTWQPKDSRGRYQKYVKWDPAKALDPLTRAARQRIMQYGPGPLRAAAIWMEADNLIKGATGVSPTKTVINGTIDALANMYRTKPDMNIGPILPF